MRGPATRWAPGLRKLSEPCLSVSFEPDGAQFRCEAFARARGLSAQHHQHFTEGAAQPMQLVDQVQNDRDAFVVDAKVPRQVLDQSRPRKIDFGKRPLSASMPRSQQSCIDP